MCVCSSVSIAGLNVWLIHNVLLALNYSHEFQVREAKLSAFNPVKTVPIPYHNFGLVDICDPQKEIVIEERVLLYYKYDNNPVDCVKIFASIYDVKPIGFRLLQYNLVDSDGEPWDDAIQQHKNRLGYIPFWGTFLDDILGYVLDFNQIIFKFTCAIPIGQFLNPIGVMMEVSILLSILGGPGRRVS